MKASLFVCCIHTILLCVRCILSSLQELFIGLFRNVFMYCLWVLCAVFVSWNLAMLIAYDCHFVINE